MTSNQKNIHCKQHFKMETKGASWGKAHLRLHFGRILFLVPQIISYELFSSTLLGVTKTKHKIIFVLEKKQNFYTKKYHEKKHSLPFYLSDFLSPNKLYTQHV